MDLPSRPAHNRPLKLLDHTRRTAWCVRESPMRSVILTLLPSAALSTLSCAFFLSMTKHSVAQLEASSWQAATLRPSPQKFPHDLAGLHS